jgi:hypothetical protein
MMNIIAYLRRELPEEDFDSFKDLVANDARNSFLELASSFKKITSKVEKKNNLAIV